MKQYENALHAMGQLLAAVGEKHWSAWIRDDLERWSSRAEVDHHLSAYGGMGSFNDLIICPENGHIVTKVQEPWANETFEWLKSLCFQFARDPSKDWNLDDLRRKVGRYDAAIAAFVGGDTAPASMRGLSKALPQLHGW